MTVDPFDLATMQAISKAASETVRQEAIASGQMLPVWTDQGVVMVDPNKVDEFNARLHVGARSPVRGPLIIDLKDPLVGQTISLASERGFITYAEIGALLPESELTSEQMEELMALFSVIRVNVIEHQPVTRMAPPTQQADVVANFADYHRKRHAGGVGVNDPLIAASR
jgi:hypothetical protein